MLAQQNLLIALTLSVVGGLSQILVVFVVAYPKYYVNVLGNQISPCLQKMILPSNILLNVISGLFIGSSAMFGPVAIVVPTRLASQLLFNMIMFGVVTKMETFDKSARVGTYIVTLGAILLPIVGPTTQEQDAIELLTRPFSMAWSIFLLAVIVAASVVNTLFVAPDKITGTPAFVSMLSANVFGSVLAASLGKSLVSVTGWQMAVVGVLVLFAFVSIVHSTILHSTRVDQKLFVPALTCGNQTLNAVTGLIIWQDWKVIQSWAGYLVVLIIILLGVYLTSTINNEDRSVNHSAAAVTRSKLVSSRHPEPVVSEIGVSDKHKVSSKAYTRRLSSSFSAEKNVIDLGKRNALEIGYGDIDDNDKDLSQSRRGKASRRSSLKLIGDSIMRLSLNSIGDSSRSIMVHDANACEESMTPAESEKSNTDDRNINSEELVSLEDYSHSEESTSLVSSSGDLQRYDTIPGKPNVESSTENFEGSNSLPALSNNLRSVMNSTVGQSTKNL